MVSHLPSTPDAVPQAGATSGMLQRTAGEIALRGALAAHWGSLGASIMLSQTQLLSFVERTRCTSQRTQTPHVLLGWNQRLNVAVSEFSNLCMESGNGV